VLAAYHGLCPTAPGSSDDYWAYSTG